MLRDTDIRGMYESRAERRPAGSAVSTVLLEPLLVDTEAGAIRLTHLGAHPALFPFSLAVSVAHVRGASQFRVYREGLGSDYVALEVKEAFADANTGS